MATSILRVIRSAKLQEAGWAVGKDRVHIWRREGLKVPQKQRPVGGCG